MSNLVVDSAPIRFDPQFGHRLVTPIGPTVVKASAFATVAGQALCVVDDLVDAQFDAQYTVPGHNPGTGKIKITKVVQAKPTALKIGGKLVVTRDARLMAEFKPTSPATLSSPPNSAEPTAPTLGQGTILITQTFVASR